MTARIELPADHPHVAVVTMARPERANALDPPTLQQLAAAWHRIADDPDIRCAVLTGAGERVFCAGMDMKTTIPASQRLARGERVDDDTFAGLRSVATATLAGFDLDTPLICAVNGHARAGGFDLMLAAEIRYAVPHATFALEEVALDSTRRATRPSFCRARSPGCTRTSCCSRRARSTRPARWRWGSSIGSSTLNS